MDLGCWAREERIDRTRANPMKMPPAVQVARVSTVVAWRPCQDTLCGGHTATHGGEAATLPRLEEDDDGQEDSVEHEKGQQKTVHHLIPVGVWQSI
jgi:hypothetical protein